MYLNLLSHEEQTAFLEIADTAIKFDGKITENERALYQNFMEEMGIEHYEIVGKSIDDSILYFKTDISKNILFLEILFLIRADGTNLEQNKFIEELREKLKISELKRNTILDWVFNLYELYDKGQKIIESSEDKI